MGDAFMVFDWLLSLFILGGVSFIVLIFVLLWFGKVIVAQFNARRLAKKGYYMIDHIEDSGLHKFYFLKPKDEMYDVSSGLYQHIKETSTRTYELMSNWRFDSNQVTWRFGIPTLTYYGSDINPVNFKNRDKVYDAKQMKGYAMLLLMATKSEEFKRILNYLLIGACVLTLILGVFVIIMNQQASTIHMCQAQLNYTQVYLFDKLDSVNACTFFNGSSAKEFYINTIKG